MRLRTLMTAMLSVIVMVSCGSKGEEKDNRVRRNLNKELTNEMSDTSSLTKMDREISTFMSKYDIKGMSVSIMRNDSLFYAKGYGLADAEKGTEMTPGTIMRVASVSKLITAVGIMKLQEQGKLSLSDKVFGPEGILCDTVYTSAITDKRYFDITVEHLLRHQGGFSTRAGDPMFSTLTMMAVHHLDAPPTHAQLIEGEIARKLKFDPGKSQDYSNFGYMILSEIIEAVTGQEYEKWMQKNVLKPAGCEDMHIAYNYYDKRYKNETRYHMHSNDDPVKEYTGSGRDVVRCYGGNDIRALAGAGAWVTSTPELMRLVASIDGRPWVPDILSAESVHEMTRYIDKNTYGLGWNDTNPVVGWSRTGTFSGTNALVKYFPDGECWILVTNTGSWMGPRFSNYMTQLVSKLRGSYGKSFPARDFFYLDEPR